jgi:dimethylamine monooxygenase subunit A
MSRAPFYDGPPRFDVGLKPIGLADWLLPDDQAGWLAEKNQLLDTQRDAVFVADAASLPAQHEVATLIATELGVILNTDEPPLVAAARHVSDDLVIMQQRDGAWTNTACCLCNPTFFSAGFAYGKSLASLHAPVPDGDFGLASRIGRVFTNLAPNKVLERHNWTVQWSDTRYCPDGGPLRAAAAAADTSQGADHLFVRVERQTIRALPASGAILFTIRIQLSQLAPLLANPDHAAAFRQAWTDAPQNVRDYKKWAVLERHVAHLLEGCDTSVFPICT